MIGLSRKGDTSRNRVRRGGDGEEGDGTWEEGRVELRDSGWACLLGARWVCGWIGVCAYPSSERLVQCPKVGVAPLHDPVPPRHPTHHLDHVHRVHLHTRINRISG